MPQHQLVKSGFIVALLAIAHLEVTHAQFFSPQGGFRQAPQRQGSLSRVNSNAYQREIDYGPIDFTQGVSNSRVVTRNNGGFRNGGTTNVANTNAISRGVNVAGLPIEGTFTQTLNRNNGQVSRGVGYGLDVGRFGLDTSISRDNLRNGFGLQRDPNGGVSLGLGLLNIDLSRNQQPQANAPLTQAQVNAQGQNARVRANSNVNTQQQQYGNVGVRETFSNSNGVARVRNGQTSGLTQGLVNGAQTNGATYGQNYYRRRRAPAPSRAYNRPQQYRPKRSPQFAPQYRPFYPAPAFYRPRRQFGGFQQPGFGFQQPYFGFGFQQPGFGYDQSQRQQQKRKSNRRPQQPQLGFNQQAGANTHSNNQFGPNGFIQDNGASSIGSNLAEDGSRGQVSSANVAQKNEQNANGIRNSNNAQSQSLNFNPNGQQATSTNAGTLHTRDQNSERLESNSGSQATNNNQFGSSSNIANTNSALFQNGQQQGATSDASGQSIYQGANGETANALTNSQTSSIRGPNGFVSNSASSNASAVSKNGGNASANSVANAGGAGGTNAGAGAEGGNGNAAANSGAFGGFDGFQAFGNAQRQPFFRAPRHATAQHRAHSNGVRLNITDVHHSANLTQMAHEVIDLNRVNRPHKSNTTELFDEIDESQPQARTFQQIGDFITGLLGGCVTPCTIQALRQNQCCDALIYAPQQPFGCCQVNPVILTDPLRPVLPRPPPPLLIAPPIPQLNCCNFCSYQNYGMPPCWRYGRGGYYGNGVGLGVGGGLGFGGGFGGINVQPPNNVAVSNANSITIQVRPPYYG